MKPFIEIRRTKTVEQQPEPPRMTADVLGALFALGGLAAMAVAGWILSLVMRL